MKKQVKEELLEVLNDTMINMDDIEKIYVLKKILLQYEEEIAYEKSNKGKAWSDDELRIIFSYPPTRENCLKLAKAFKRGQGSITQIYKWAATSNKTIEQQGRADDAFILQIKRISKEQGWVI